MRLSPKLVPGWPKLAWLAVAPAGADSIEVLHGPRVEVGDGWCAEAVWAGPFEAADFDRTDLVFGSGVRVRGSEVVFVTSATAMDRLWTWQGGGTTYVSNSLGALCARAGLRLIDGDTYANDCLSTIGTRWGATVCTRAFPTQSGEGHVAWFNNLVYDGRTLREEVKPDVAPAFTTFASYYDFLIDAARRLGENLKSPARRHGVAPLTSVSSGYDSPAVAVIAKHAGCTEAVTIRQAASMWRGSDSGEAIAERLGLACRCYDRIGRTYPNEAAFWAASGYANLLNWTLFEYPEPVCLFFVGCYGDSAWARKALTGPLEVDIFDDLAMGEWRLHAGVFQCVVPFWGLRHVEEIRRVTFSAEMAPWTVGGSYDRPIPRRIVEEAGIPRGEFAVRKKNSSHEAAFRWPYSPEAHDSLARYLRGRGLYAPGRLAVRLIRRMAHMETILHNNVCGPLGIRRRLTPWQRIAGTHLLVQWANEEMTQLYRRGLEGCGQAPPVPRAAAGRAGEP
jgi:hypothetical protein